MSGEPVPQEMGSMYGAFLDTVVLRAQIAVGVEDLKNVPAKVALPALKFNEDDVRQPHREREQRIRQRWPSTVMHGCALPL